MQLPIYFFGDNHFSPIPSSSNDKKIKKLEQFIDSLDENCGSIFIMGDFFDYYFEYKKNNPNNFERIFLTLDRIKKRGFEIYFMAGNHDYWIGDIFRSYTTASFLDDQILSVGEKKIYVTHGDGILSWDKGYRLLRIILRSRIFNFIYSLIPKFLALKIAEKISYERKDSHQKNNELLEKIHNELIDFSRQKWNDGSDIVIMGHYHHSFRFNENNKELIIIDDCSEDSFNYVMYDGQSVTVKSL